MAKAKNTVTVYVVQRIDWEYNDEFNERYDPTELNSLQSFLTREKAEAYRQRLERARRGDENPFSYGDSPDLTGYSTFSADAFRTRIEAAGLAMISPRRSARFNYWDWYESLSGATDEQRHAVWDALDLVRFYEIEPMKVELED